MKLLKTTAVRHSNKTNETGCEVTLPQTLRDFLEVAPGEDYLDWFLDGNNVIVRKAEPKGDR